MIPSSPSVQDLLVEDLAFTLEVIQKTDEHPPAAAAFAAAAFEPSSGSGPHVEAVQGQEIEGIERHRVLHHRPPDIESPGQLAALLESLKAGPPGLIERNHFAVEDDAG